MSRVLRHTGVALGIVSLVGAIAWWVSHIPTARPLTAVAPAARAPGADDDGRLEIRRDGAVVGWIRIRTGAAGSLDPSLTLASAGSPGGGVLVPASSLVGTLGTRNAIPNQMPTPSSGGGSHADGGLGGAFTIPGFTDNADHYDRAWNVRNSSVQGHVVSTGRGRR